MFNSLNSTAAFFGPKPGMRNIVSTLCGTCAWSSTSIGRLPVAPSVAIFSARSLPTPEMSVSLRFESASTTSIDSGKSRIARAPLR